MAGFLSGFYVFVVLHTDFLATISSGESKYMYEVAVAEGALPSDTLKTH